MAVFRQQEIILPAYKRGCHFITKDITSAMQSHLAGIKCGLAHIFIKHTSASLTINEVKLHKYITTFIATNMEHYEHTSSPSTQYHLLRVEYKSKANQHNFVLVLNNISRAECRSRCSPRYGDFS